MGIGYATTIAGNGANVLTVNGIKATAQNVCTTNLTQQYPFSRYLYLLQNLSSTDSEVVANRSNATAFIQFMLSSAGQNIVAQQNFIRLQPTEDINGDGTISIQDLSRLGLMWNHSTAAGNLTITAADINGDGIVSVQDLSLLGLWWNITYGTPTNPTPNYVTLTSFTPSSGSVGSTVTITGTGFTGATAVDFGTTSATFSNGTGFSADTTITATVPAGLSGKVNISVTCPGGIVTSANQFTPQ